MKHFSIVILAAVLFAALGYAQDSKSNAGGGASSGGVQIVDAKLGTAIADKEITGEDSSFAMNSKVWLWLKTKGGASEDLTLTWACGSFSKDTKVTIGGSPWRTWSAKTAAKAGNWTVTVKDASGATLKSLSFKVQ
jgi:hypothetical protein